MFKNGEIVYVNSIYNVAEKCEITGYVKREPNTGQFFYIVHPTELGSNFDAATDCIFKTREEAIKSYQKHSEEIKEKYKSEITSLEDLLRFPLDHCLNGEEYTDYEARQAYTEKINELTKFKI